MPGQSALVVPEVLRWARESAGLSEDEAARRIGLTRTERLLQAEAGSLPLTLNQVRKAAQVYQRPLAALFLPEPPSEDPPEVQFRRLRDAPELPWPPPMRALARSVAALQDDADALFEAIEEEPRWPEAVRLFRAPQSLEELGSQLRELLGVPLESQKAASRSDPQGFRTFRLWREAIEDFGILVLQDGSLTVEDMRGFAAPHERVPALVINTTDDVGARLFTMLHEFAHLFWQAREEMRFEEFAGTVLMPSGDFERDVRAAPGGTLLAKFDATARSYGVTSDAAAVRAGWLQLASWDEIDVARAEIRDRRSQRGERAQGGNYYRNVVVRMGPRFVSRVLDAVGETAISELSAARLLGVRVDKFETLRREVMGNSGA